MEPNLSDILQRIHSKLNNFIQAAGPEQLPSHSAGNRLNGAPSECALKLASSPQLSKGYSLLRQQSSDCHYQIKLGPNPSILNEEQWPMVRQEPIRRIGTKHSIQTPTAESLRKTETNLEIHQQNYLSLRKRNNALELDVKKLQAKLQALEGGLSKQEHREGQKKTEEIQKSIITNQELNKSPQLNQPANSKRRAFPIQIEKSLRQQGGLARQFLQIKSPQFFQKFYSPQNSKLKQVKRVDIEKSSPGNNLLNTMKRWSAQKSEAKQINQAGKQEKAGGGMVWLDGLKKMKKCKQKLKEGVEIEGKAKEALKSGDSRTQSNSYSCSHIKQQDRGQQSKLINKKMCTQSKLTKAGYQRPARCK